MSGTSLDGVDAVVVETDGESRIRLLATSYVPYSEDLRARVGKVARGDVPLNEVMRVEQAVTEAYAHAVALLARQGVRLGGIHVIGCHGQTIRHVPEEGLTWQMGDMSLLAELTGVPVVGDFRRRDMAAGGQGAPLVPLYHRALVGEKRACGVLNIGGVANVTWFDGKGGIRAGDTGPGVGILNTWMERKARKAFDKDGALALAGKADMGVVARALRGIGFWARKLPRSADRYEFAPVLDMLKGMDAKDGAATLCALTAAGVARTLADMKVKTSPKAPLYVVGGGANNPALMVALLDAGVHVRLGHEGGLRGDTLEAECFAWLAVRRLRHLPFSLPATTGCLHGTVGGTLTA